MADFVYKPPKGPPLAMDATLGVKFSQQRVILDEWWIFGGTRWSRALFRLKHPIVYSKRGLRGVWRRIKSIFVKERPSIMYREWISKEEAKKLWPENTKKKNARHRSM